MLRVTPEHGPSFGRTVITVTGVRFNASHPSHAAGPGLRRAAAAWPPQIEVFVGAAPRADLANRVGHTLVTADFGLPETESHMPFDPPEDLSNSPHATPYVTSTQEQFPKLEGEVFRRAAAPARKGPPMRLT